MATPHDIIDNLKCVVCLELCKDAVECLQCGNVFCKVCVLNLKCPLCRNHSSYRDSFFARRIIDNLPLKCENCKTSTTRKLLESHMIECPERVFHCKSKNCEFTAKKEDFGRHLTELHLHEILDEFDQHQEKKKSSHLSLFNPKINAVGKTAVRGTTGRFYCGERSDVNCGGCDGNCGPSSGCQCTHCLKLDVEFYNLPAGFLLNHVGNLAQLVDDKFYCGVRKNRNSICSPEEGICDACSLMSNLTNVKNCVISMMEIKKIK